MEFVRVDGKDCGDVVLYALSTCRWCKMTKQLLEDLDVGYRYVFVDLLDKDSKAKAQEQMRRHDRSGSFPMIVVDGKDVIIGYNEEQIQKVAER